MKDPKTEELEFQRNRAKEIKISLFPDYLINRYKENKYWRLFHKEFVFKKLGNFEGKEILDFGCGEGQISVLLAKFGGKVTGLDISPELIDIAKRSAEANKVQNNTKFIVKDILEAPPEKNIFDFILCNDIFHHVDIYSVFPLLLDCLKPHGKIIIKEPVAFSHFLQRFRNITPVKKEGSPGERQLNKKDIDFLKKLLVNKEVAYFALFGRLSRLFPNCNKIDKGHPFTKAALLLLFGLDRILLTLFPFLSNLCGVVVILGEKTHNKI